MTNKNFIVYRSSAGSGKTYTLVKEYLRIALSKKSESYYRHILAITFTNKAAAEMKERVISRLKEMAMGPDDNSYDKEFCSSLASEIGIEENELCLRASKSISHILHNYSELSISTIDSFVHRLIRSFSTELHLSPDFEVEIDTDVVLAEAVERLLEKTGIDKSLTQVLISFALAKIEDGKHWDIKNDIFDYGKNILKEDSIEWLKKLNTLNIEDFKGIRKKIETAISSFEKEVAAISQEALDLIKSRGIQEDDFSRSSIPNYFKRICSGDFKEVTATINKQMAGEASMYPKKANEGAKAAIDEISSELQALFGNLQELLNSEYFRKYNTLKDAHKSLYSIALLNEIKKEAEEIKEENNIILISDFNRIISKVVMNNPSPFIYEKIGERYNHFLIDEFQDTSLSQWQNFLPLLENSLSKNYMNLIVGDGKQAIYRWRNGEVQQFNKLPEIYGQENNPLVKDTEAVLKRNYEKKNLEFNYRSSIEVVDFNNRFIGELKNHLGEYTSIYDGWEQKTFKKKHGYVTVDKSIAKLKEERTELNLEIIKNRIDESIGDGYGQEDIAILVRSNRDAVEIASFLMSKNYSVISSESLLLKNSNMVSALINTLSFLANENDEGAKSGIIRALHSCGLLGEDLNAVYLKYSKFQNKKGGIQIANMLEEHFDISQLEQLKSKGLYEICEYLLGIYGFHKKADVFMEFFLNSIAKFEEKENSHISSFLSWWHDKKENLSIGMTEGHAGVRIMTIHKSKGLQFPVVIYPIRYSSGGKGSSIWIEGGLPEVNLPGAILPYTDNKATTHVEDYEIEFKKQNLDKFNVIYVALTRAEDRLHVILEAEKPFEHYEAPSAMHEYIEMSLSSAFEDYSHEESHFSYGERTPKTKKNVLPESISLNQYHVGSFQNNLSIAFRASRYWGDENSESSYGINSEAAGFGILVHRLLSMINTKDELAKAVSDLKLEANMGEEQLLSATKLVKSLLENETISKWFAPGLKIKNEAAIIKENGKISRPDRIVFFENHIDVIDYKTGSEREEHHKQIQEYQKQVEELEEKTVNAFLVYTDEVKVVGVG